MEADFWRVRWQEGRTPFHEGKPNSYLERHIARLDDRKRVLVPMCGKAEDLAFLASRGHLVVGVELVEDAVRAFFDERRATPAITARGALTEYEMDSIRILAGDVFATSRDVIGPIDAIYDRAALVALPPETRPRYVAHLRALAPAATIMLLSFEYPQELMTGPPFAVMEAEVRSLYTGARIELVDEGPDPRVREGISAIERCYVITP